MKGVHVAGGSDEGPHSRAMEAQRVRTVFVAVPVAAVAGLLVPGIVAFIVALLIAILDSGDFDLPALDFGGGRGSQKRSRQQ